MGGGIGVRMGAKREGPSQQDVITCNHHDVAVDDALRLCSHQDEEVYCQKNVKGDFGMLNMCTPPKSMDVSRSPLDAFI